jgi:hypothetical protein
MIDSVLMVLGSLMALWCCVALVVTYGPSAALLGVGLFLGAAVAIAAAEDRRERRAREES